MNLQLKSNLVFTVNFVKIKYFLTRYYFTNINNFFIYVWQKLSKTFFRDYNFWWKLSDHNFENINRDLLPKFWIKLRSCKSISSSLPCRYSINNWCAFHLPKLRLKNLFCWQELFKITKYFTAASSKQYCIW